MWYRENLKLSCSVRVYREKRYHEWRSKRNGCFEAVTGVGRIYEVKKNKEK
jgi:hypothetical protein